MNKKEERVLADFLHQLGISDHEKMKLWIELYKVDTDDCFDVEEIESWFEKQTSDPATLVLDEVEGEDIDLNKALDGRYFYCSNSSRSKILKELFSLPDNEIEEMKQYYQDIAKLIR